MTSFLKADRSRPVALWLFITAALVVVMVVIGGATRLTDSGLSITEWKPLAGVIPPMSDAGWAKEFAAYQRIPQFTQMNPDMTVASFKGIYWWEWTHRLLGRLLGLVFAIPFAWFLYRKEIPRRLIFRCFGLLALGALQGLVGWWMVSSGLTHNVTVAPERLAIHLGLALILFGGLVWSGLEAEYGQARVDAYGPWARGGAALTSLIFFQILLGALVAGNDAGKVYNDWPLMSGRLVPADYAAGDGVWSMLAHNPATVQFNHRIMAYIVVACVIAFAVVARRSRHVQPEVRNGAYVLAGLTLLQAAVGVATLMLTAPLLLSMLHQLVAVALLAVAVWTTWRARRV